MKGQTTFVLFGKMKGQTVNIGPDQKYRFVNGRMQVSDDIADLVERSLRFYNAAPEDKVGPLHEAACRTLRVDPETLEPVSAETPKRRGRPPKAKVPENMAEVVRDETLRVVADLDDGEDAHWTQEGLPRLDYVKERLPESFREYVSRELLDEIGRERETTS